MTQRLTGVTRHILSVLGYIVATFLVQGTSHFRVFARHYAGISILRSEPDFVLGFSSMVIQGSILSYVFAGSRCDTGRLKDGIVLSWLFGAFLVSYIALAEAGKYAVPSIPSWMAVETGVGFVQYTLIGALYALAHRTRPDATAEISAVRKNHDREEKDIMTEELLVASAIHAWKQNLDRAGKAFSGLTDRQLQIEVAPGRNRLLYLWGHLTAVHDAMLPLLGVGNRLHPELDAAFVKAADKAVDGLPAPSVLQHCWDEVNGELLKAFEKFTASDWARKHTAVSEEDFAANPLRNRLSVLLSRTNHLSYHIGQVALAPK